MKMLKIDDKWSIQYDPNNNDRPVAWFRNDERQFLFRENSKVLAMFYALLEAER